MRGILLLLLITMVGFGCSKDDNPAKTNSTPSVFYIDLQTSFQHDSVRVSVDQNPIFVDTITTSPILSRAKRITPAVLTGLHTVKVEILNMSVSGDTTIIVSDTTTLAVNFIRSTKNIVFTKYSWGLTYR